MVGGVVINQPYPGPVGRPLKHFDGEIALEITFTHYSHFSAVSNYLELHAQVSYSISI